MISLNANTTTALNNNNQQRFTSNGDDHSKSNLIVNYLPQSLKEQDLQNLFQQVGPIRTCKLMHDMQTGTSFGYGFVDFQNPEDAQKAIDTFNGFQMENKRLKVAYARPNTDDIKNTNLYIRNIPTNFDENTLNELFQRFGDVVQVRILRDQNQTFTKRAGFVIMGTQQQAQAAINGLDNQVPGSNVDEPIYVKYAEKDGKKRQSRNFHNNNNYISNQKHYNFSNTNGSGLYNNFHSTVQPSRGDKLRTNNRGHNTRFNTNFGYYSNSQSTNVYQYHNQQQQQHFNHFNSNNNSHYNIHQQTHNSINRSLSQEKREHVVYVYGIGPHANETDLYELFKNFGRILRVNVIKNKKSNLGKGYGFVVFDNHQEASHAVQQINGFIYNNRPLQVSLKESM